MNICTVLPQIMAQAFIKLGVRWPVAGARLVS